MDKLRSLWRAYRFEGFLHCRSCASLARQCGSGRLRALRISLSCRLHSNWKTR